MFYPDWFSEQSPLFCADLCIPWCEKILPSQEESRADPLFPNCDPVFSPFLRTQFDHIMLMSSNGQGSHHLSVKILNLSCLYAPIGEQTLSMTAEWLTDMKLTVIQAGVTEDSRKQNKNGTFYFKLDLKNPFFSLSMRRLPSFQATVRVIKPEMVEWVCLYGCMSGWHVFNTQWLEYVSTILVTVQSKFNRPSTAGNMQIKMVMSIII